ncbi:MAG: 50S ribosomal protein L7/L12 [Candidatus Stahlbacteria bacterium]|nr:50S ribosomal protein L7/L12 [Candidatus Stahlbacteria bacterium]
MAEKKDVKVKVDAKVKVIESIEKMSVLELSELIKGLEEKFGVKAAPVAVASAPAAAAASADEKPAEEKVEFDVFLKSFEDKKIPVIKSVREVTDLGLKEAKELVEGAPCVVKAKVSKDEAEAIAKRIVAAGGICEVK